MRLEPEYDPETKEWFVEYEGQEFTSRSLAGLKANCPDGIQFKGYHPMGYAATRGSGLTDRKPFITYKHKNGWRESPKVAPQPEPAPVATKHRSEPVYVQPPKVRTKFQLQLKPGEVVKDKVFSLRSRGYNSREIADILHCSVETILGMFKLPERTNWTDELDAQLRHYVEVEKLPSSVIGKKMGRTKNAIIGRCHRKGIKLTYLSFSDLKHQEAKRRADK